MDPHRYRFRGRAASLAEDEAGDVEAARAPNTPAWLPDRRPSHAHCADAAGMASAMAKVPVDRCTQYAVAGDAAAEQRQLHTVADVRLHTRRSNWSLESGRVADDFQTFSKSCHGSARLHAR
jgi:hypothetical protein